MRRKAEKGVIDIFRFSGNLRQHRLDAFGQQFMQAVKADLDIVTRAALMRGAHAPLCINQHEFGLSAAAIDAQEIPHYPIYPSSWIRTPCTTRLTVPEAFGLSGVRLWRKDS